MELSQTYTVRCLTVEHALPPKNALSPLGFDPRTSRIVNHRSGKNRGKCQISDECSNNERLLLDEMHILKMVVNFCTKLSFTVSRVLAYFATPFLNFKIFLKVHIKFLHKPIF
jgi:hypothetical protein